MMNRAMDKDEIRWRAESDARCLARAEEIKADKERMTLAKKSAEQMYQEQQRELQGLAKVSGKKVAVTKEEPAKDTSHPYGVFKR